jgi:hypothetical protein
MSLEWAEGIVALSAAAVFVLLILIRQRRLRFEDIGGVYIALGAGAAIPRSIFLFSYFFYPDPQDVLTKLQPYKIDISAVGLILFLINVIALGRLYRNAFTRVRRATEASDTSGESSKSVRAANQSDSSVP